MYFWKIKTLKNQLIHEGLCEHETFKYLAAYVALNALVAVPIKDSNYLDIILGFIFFIIAMMGLFVAFRANGGKEGKQFVQRYLSIGLVVGIRWFVFFLLIYTVGLSLFYGFVLDEIPEQTTLLEFVMFIAFDLLFYVMLIRHISMVAKASASASTQPTQLIC